MSKDKGAHPVRRKIVVLLLFLLGMTSGVLVDRVFLAGIIPGGLVSANAVYDFRLMALAWNLIESRYVDQQSIKPRQMTYGAISGMVDALGDTGHSGFLTPKMVKLSQDITTGNFAGIGAEIGVKHGHVVIISPIDDTPASRAGLKPGDAILKVDNKPVGNLPLADVVARIRGPAGKPVTLDILSPKAEMPHEVTIVRAEIPIDTVHWHMVPGTHIADLRISSFSKGTTNALAKALSEAKQHGARAVILDLRNDPGGLLTEAIGVASLFMDKGDVLKERDRAGKVQAIPVEPNLQRWAGPVAVLVNGGTASAAEIVSGALRDNRNAPLIGEKTFGTGTVLQEFSMPDGSAVLLAVREWLTPNGESFWHKGLVPTQKIALGNGVIPLHPNDLKHMTPAKLRASHDKQLLAAVKRLQSMKPHYLTAAEK
ncbi:MAG: S41 family peptidase [Gammaproteobacteria bacterium]